MEKTEDPNEGQNFENGDAPFEHPETSPEKVTVEMVGEEVFTPPPTVMPATKAPVASVFLDKGPLQDSGWPDIPGNPGAPIYCDFAPYHGWAAGGPILTTLCQTNEVTGAPGCRNFNAALRSCNSAIPLSLIGKLPACPNYKPND